MHQPFTFSPMPKLAAGPGTAAGLGETAASFGRTALLVTGSVSFERTGHLSRTLADLKKKGLQVHHCRIAGEPSPVSIDRAVGGSRNKAVDLVIAVGGGSVLDAGKAIAAMLKESGTVVDYLEGVGTRQPSGESVPVIAVPTTSGTGSEATQNAVISQVGSYGFKKSLRHENYVPRLAILDPLLCVSAPPPVTAACGMDALTQLMESYVSTHASPLTDALAMEGMRHLIPALPDACGKGATDLGCRSAVAYGAFLSGVTLANAGLGAIHGVAGPMGAIIAIPHGVACANLLPYAVKATIDNLIAVDTDGSRIAIEKFARIGQLFGAVYESALDDSRHLVECLYRWLDDLALPRSGKFGLTIEHVGPLVRAASNKNHPLPLSEEQIETMILDRR